MLLIIKHYFFDTIFYTLQVWDSAGPADTGINIIHTDTHVILFSLHIHPYSLQNASNKDGGLRRAIFEVGPQNSLFCSSVFFLAHLSSF